MRALSVTFRFDAGGSVGMGHLIRCRSLARSLQEKTKCLFRIVTSRADLVKETWQGLNPCIEKPNQTDAGHRSIYGVLDLPKAHASDFNLLKGVADRVVWINDSDSASYPVDILVRPNILYPLCAAQTRTCECLSGSNYVILDPSYQGISKHAKPIREEIRTVFVCFGGSDPRHYTSGVLRQLDRGLRPDIQIRAAIGPAFDRRRIPGINQSRSHRLTILNSPSELASEFHGADMALIGGGTLLYEACALGVPSIVLPQTAEQYAEAKKFESRGAVVVLSQDPSIAAVMGEVDRLSDALMERAELSRNAKIAVSVSGASALAQKMLTQSMDCYPFVSSLLPDMPGDCTAKQGAQQFRTSK